MASKWTFLSLILEVLIHSSAQLRRKSLKKGTMAWFCSIFFMVMLLYFSFFYILLRFFNAKVHSSVSLLGLSYMWLAKALQKFLGIFLVLRLIKRWLRFSPLWKKQIFLFLSFLLSTYFLLESEFHSWPEFLLLPLSEMKVPGCLLPQVSLDQTNENQQTSSMVYFLCRYMISVRCFMELEATCSRFDLTWGKLMFIGGFSALAILILLVWRQVPQASCTILMRVVVWDRISGSISGIIIGNYEKELQPNNLTPLAQQQIPAIKTYLNCCVFWLAAIIGLIVLDITIAWLLQKQWQYNRLIGCRVIEVLRVGFDELASKQS